MNDRVRISVSFSKENVFFSTFVLERRFQNPLISLALFRAFLLALSLFQNLVTDRGASFAFGRTLNAGILLAVLSGFGRAKIGVKLNLNVFLSAL